jgi:hypothetical protein
MFSAAGKTANNSKKTAKRHDMSLPASVIAI